MKRLTHRLLTTDIWVVDALLWWKAFNWFLTLALAPDASFSSLNSLSHVLAIKLWWVGPAALATAFPLIDLATNADWFAHLARLYTVGWWVAMCVLLLVLEPTFIVFWGGAFIGVLLALWTLLRQTAGRHAVTP